MLPHTVVIIEDQRMFRELLRGHIDTSESLRVIGTAATAAEGFTCCRQHHPTVVLIDIKLPDGSGIDLGKRLLQVVPTINLVAVSSLTDPTTTTRVFESGFRGYVEKDQPPDVIIEALETAAEGGLYFTQLVRENRRRITTHPDALNKVLSLREQQIVGLVACGKPNKDMATQLDISVRTVENHRYRIMKKLALADTGELAAFGRQMGLDQLPPN